MKIGLLWKSNKENEKRYPLYWKDLDTLSSEQLDRIYFEEGYPGLEQMKNHNVFNFEKRNKIFDVCDMIVLPKPTSEDYKSLKERQILWGWPHSVQGFEIVEAAIKKRLTIIAWENMFKWTNNTKKEHIFARNNEMAGYAAINHFMELRGITPGVYGEELKIAILGFGSTSRGAINSLLGLGATDITVFSRRSKYEIADAIKNVKYGTYECRVDGTYINNKPSYEELNKYDLIVNCILQDPLNPIIFLKESQIKEKRLSIVDISCDYQMGFDFARPTSFDKPLISTDKYIYYSVDHTPSYYWNAASFEISGALLPYLKYMLQNNTFKGNTVLEKAVDIESGHIVNKSILKFQKRSKEYPHNIID